MDSPIRRDEAILKGGVAICYVSSGGFAHYIKKSMAMGYVPTEQAITGNKVEVEILGEMYSTEIQGGPLYDPDGEKMRG